MDIVEIRDLDGPNLFLLQPAIKLEIAIKGSRPLVAEAGTREFLIGRSVTRLDVNEVDDSRLLSLLTETVNVIHDQLALPRPPMVSRRMESPGHVAIAFGWRHRSLGKGIARTAFDIVAGRPIDIETAMASLMVFATSPPAPEQLPELLLDEERSLPTVGITGTNGKTTTTRLLSSILMGSGRRVAWTSSAGVFVQGENVLPGDYTGPAGAARVFEETDIDVGVLETARGGILLRGLGYESNDVSVVTNISADHLGLQGVHTVEELARVKQVVAAVTKADGVVVLNADDELVLGMRAGVKARVFLVSRQPDNPAIRQHIEGGGWAMWVGAGQVHLNRGGVDEVLTSLTEIPITFGGKAQHMLENALCAAAAALALGLDTNQVAHGLAEFRNEADQNRGRLNVFRVNGVVAIADFAHNPAGLKHLLDLGRGMTDDGSELIAVVGTAGDRPDDALVEMGRIAALGADKVIVKDTVKYLRGREPGEIPALLLAGVSEVRKDEAPVMPTEFAAFQFALETAKSGDAVAIMCIEDVDRILDHLTEVGSPIS